MFSHLGPQGTGAKYQVVKLCALLSLAEIKELTPWEPHDTAYGVGPGRDWHRPRSALDTDLRRHRCVQENS